jgi:hypothetical protein
MNKRNRKNPKLFTVDEANACLPLVGAITADVVSVARDVQERRQRLELLSRGRNATPGDPYAEELAQIQQELAKDEQRLSEYHQELVELGAILQDAGRGLIDFPAMFEGRLVHLCWAHGETEVLHWHEVGAGFAGRQPLTVASAADASGDADGELFGESP